MLLLLRDILNNPGVIPFEFELELDPDDILTMVETLAPIPVRGTVTNSADLLTLRCELELELLMLCERCGSEYIYTDSIALETILSNDYQDPDSDEFFPITGSTVDLNDIIRVLLLLDLPSASICNDDCAFDGLEYN